MTGAQPAATVALPVPAPAPSRQRANMRRGAKLIFFSVALFPLFLMMSLAADEPAPLIVPFMLFMAGLVWWSYARLFGEDIPQAARYKSRRDRKAGADAPALGGPTFVPASSFNRQGVNTAEIPQPPSVTEQTTTLLEKDR